MIRAPETLDTPHIKGFLFLKKRFKKRKKGIFRTDFLSFS